MNNVVKVATLLLASGCSGEMGAHEDGDPQSQGLAESVETSDAVEPAQVYDEDGQAMEPTAEVEIGNATVTFYADSDGTTVFFFGPVEEVEDLVNPADFSDSVKLYELLANEPAPAALVEAEEAQKLATPSEDDNADVEFVEADDVVPAHPRSADDAVYASIHSSSQWVDKYCDWGSGFEENVCHTNVVCTDSNCTLLTDRTTKSLFYVNALGSQPVQARIRRKNTWGNYKTRASMTVQFGQVLAIFDKTATYRHTRQMQIINSANRPFHAWAATYNNNILLLGDWPRPQEL